MLDRARERLSSYVESITDLKPEYLRRRERYLEREVNLLTEVLAEGMRRGELSCAEPSETALCLLLATNALMPFSLSDRMMQQRDLIEHRLHLLVSLLVRGIQAQDAFQGRIDNKRD